MLFIGICGASGSGKSGGQCGSVQTSSLLFTLKITLYISVPSVDIRNNT